MLCIFFTREYVCEDADDASAASSRGGVSMTKRIVTAVFYFLFT